MGAYKGKGCYATLTDNGFTHRVSIYKHVRNENGPERFLEIYKWEMKSRGNALVYDDVPSGSNGREVVTIERDSEGNPTSVSMLEFVMNKQGVHNKPYGKTVCSGLIRLKGKSPKATDFSALEKMEGSDFEETDTALGEATLTAT